MAHERNFPDGILDVPNFRPRRVSEQDRILIRDQNAAGDPVEREVVFGQTNRDVVEVYIVDELGDNIAHTNLRPDDPALRLIKFTADQQVGVGQDQTPDVLQIDLVNVLKRFGPIDPDTGEPEGLPPGRYAIAVNVFRDEVGQEAGDTSRKLFISDISPSRTELRLTPAFSNGRIVSEISEFVEPSVPRFVAQAIIDQAFGVSLDPFIDDVAFSVENIDFVRFEEEIVSLDAKRGRTDEFTTANRLNRASLESQLFSTFNLSIPLMRDKILDILDAQLHKSDAEGATPDLYIQDAELQSFIRDGVAKALIELVSTGGVDPRLQLINRDGTPITVTSTRLRTE